MQKERIKELAEMLDASELNQKTIEPLSETDPDMNVMDAYQIQMANVNRRLERGEIITGKKIGLTSVAMQKMIGINEPDYGHLFNTLKAENGKVPSEKLIEPRVEGEVLFVLSKDLKGPNVTPEDVLEATEYVTAGIEVVDSRVRDWKIKLVDTVSDNASCGMYVVGGKKVSPADVDLADIKMKLIKNGKVINEGTGADVLGNPANCVCWLANKLWEYGVTLKKGEVILSGALSGMVPAVKGDVFEMEFTYLGNVVAEFV